MVRKYSFPVLQRIRDKKLRLQPIVKQPVFTPPASLRLVRQPIGQPHFSFPIYGSDRLHNENLVISRKLFKAGSAQLAGRAQAQRTSSFTDLQLPKPSPIELFHARPPKSPYPALQLQLATVGAFTDLWAGKTNTLEDFEKIQVQYFVNSLLRDAFAAASGKPKTGMWRVANSLSRASTDGLGMMSVMAGYAHTADFQSAFLHAETVCKQKLDPLPYFLSYAPIHVAIQKRILPTLFSRLGAMPNVLTVGIQLHDWVPAIFRERSSQYAKFLKAQNREEDSAEFQELLSMYKWSHPELMELMNQAIGECENLEPVIQGMIDIVLAETRTTLGRSSSVTIEEIE